MSLTDMMPAPYRVLALVGLSLSLYGGGYVAGLRHEQQARDAIDARHALQDVQQRAADVERARKKEQDLREALDVETDKRHKESKDHAKELAAVRADARRGAVVLHCPAAAIPADTQTANPGTAAGSGAEAGSSRLVPEASDDLLGVAGDIVEVVRQRNSLIDSYNKARETCNAP